MVTAVSIYEEIEDAVLHLSQPERSQLATRLLESLDKDEDIEISPEWREELHRRVRDIDEGRTKLIDQDEVWKLVNERFGTSFNA
ncbi:MAG: addiction module protein [Verrucomicrobiales bacterium]|nr:addiction module protein [Verrucomicrobiales bacterium]